MHGTLHCQSWRSTVLALALNLVSPAHSEVKEKSSRLNTYEERCCVFQASRDRFSMSGARMCHRHHIVATSISMPVTHTHFAKH